MRIPQGPWEHQPLPLSEADRAVLKADDDSCLKEQHPHRYLKCMNGRWQENLPGVDVKKLRQKNKARRCPEYFPLVKVERGMNVDAVRKLQEDQKARTERFLVIAGLAIPIAIALVGIIFVA